MIRSAVMHREGANPENVALEDVLCDFCGEASWAAGAPCVEGHRGSLICGVCLTSAWRAVSSGSISEETDEPCTLCLENREDLRWRGLRVEANACLRCVKQAAGVLHKSKDWDWVKPERP